MKTMATARMPSSKAACRPARGPAPSSSGVSTVAVGVDALVDLDHPLVQQFRQHDVAVEQPGRAW
jgi:hypothetical protein